MTCLMESRQGAEILTDYCAGALDAIRTAELEAHLNECAVCRSEVDAQRNMWQTLGEWTPIEVSPDFDARLRARIAAEDDQPWWSRLSWKPLAPIAAAAAVLMVALLMWIPGSSGRFETAPSSPTAVDKADNIDLQQVQQALDDMDLLIPVGSTARAL